MSGILNPKQRILDTIVTSEGRRQMVSGKFKVEFVTFSDATTFYEADAVSGSSDASKRIYLESCLLPQDQVTFETDDAGKLMPFKNATDFDVLGGKIYSGSSSDFEFLTGSDFASTAQTLIGSTPENFKNIYSIGTIDTIFEDDEFLISDQAIRFIIDDKRPIKDPSLQTIQITNLEGFFQDKKFSNVPNFQYLPPLNKTPDGIDLKDQGVINTYKVGFFKPLGPVKKLTYDEISEEIQQAEKSGCVKVIKFDPTNNLNRLACQFFEIRRNEILKLDVLDFGFFKTGNPASPNRHVFFAGKVFLDDFGVHTFVRLFTLVFE